MWLAQCALDIQYGTVLVLHNVSWMTLHSVFPKCGDFMDYWDDQVLCSIHRCSMFLEFDGFFYFILPTNVIKRCWVMYNVITVLVNYLAMKNGCVCSVTWLTPLSAETRSPRFLYHDDLALMNISCSFWNSLIISNVVVLALMQARDLGSGQWRHYLGGSTVFSPGISKAIRLGLVLLRTTPISFPFFRSCGRPGTLLYLMPEWASVN